MLSLFGGFLMFIKEVVKTFIIDMVVGLLMKPIMD